MLTTLCNQAGAKIESYLCVHFSECHLSSTVSLNLFVFHTRPAPHNHSNQIKKIPKDSLLSLLGQGVCPISFSLGWLPAESVIKAFVMLPCCKSLLLRHNGKEQQNVKCMQQKMLYQSHRLIIDSCSGKEGKVADRKAKI